MASPRNAGMRPYDSVPFSRRGLMKLISFDRQKLYPQRDTSSSSSGNLVTLQESLGLDRSYLPDAQAGLDHACATQPYSTSLTGGPTSAVLAKEYQAWIEPGADPQQYYPFAGEGGDLPFAALLSGTLSVCYCAMVAPENDQCRDEKYWLHAAKIMIVGPVGGMTVELPTNFVVSIELRGWGFTSNDTLRAITLTQACSENSYSPVGAAEFKVGCPGFNNSGCDFPSPDFDIVAYVDTSNSTGVFLEDVLVGETNTTLVFTGDIVKYLDEGDAITIEEETVLLRQRDRLQWSEAERYTVSILTGIFAYADDDVTTRMLPNLISYVYSASGSLVRNSVRLNVGWPAGEKTFFSFVGGMGRWSRRNVLRTSEDAYAENPATMKLCWGTLDDGAQKYYGEAGTLSFVDPPTMHDAGVHLAAQEQDARSPVVLAFSPLFKKAEYRLLSEPIILRILFRDVDGMLEPLVTSSPRAEVSSLPPEEELALSNATQALCGLLFTEMWTNDVGGFPLPRGCYYGRLFQGSSSSPESVPSGGYREYFVAFEPRQGLKSECFDGRSGRQTNCLYQLVFNAHIKQIPSLKRDVVGLYTICAPKPNDAFPCGGRYSVIEYGPGKPSRISRPTNIFGQQLGLVELARHGGLRNGNETSELEVIAERTDIRGSRYMTLELRAWARNASLPITRGSRLRLVLLPLTLWDFETDVCQAVCKPPQNLSCSDLRGGETVGCELAPVVLTRFDAVVRMPRNMVDMVYPIGMDQIPPDMNDAQLIEIDEIDLPPQGFFPTRFFAQLSTKGNLDPSVLETFQSFYQVPQPRTTTGRLLAEGQAGCGPRPFVGDKNNELMVRLTLGFTLRHYGITNLSYESVAISGGIGDVDANMPMVHIILPIGYKCSIVGDGVADPERYYEYFNVDSNRDGFLDNYKGTLVSLGSWSSDGPMCSFTLESHASIFVGQIFYVQLSVINPWNVLHRDDPRNVWYISTRGMSGSILQSAVPFISLKEETLLPGWVGNLATLTPIKGASLQPSSFAPGNENAIFVFFKAVHWMPRKSYILVDAPEGFDFRELCSVADLPPAYYANYEAVAFGEDRVGDKARTRLLSEVLDCTGDQWSRGMFDPLPTAESIFNRARIKISTTLEPGAYYGFSVVVRNALEYSVAQHTTWRLWILSPEKYPVDGSKTTVPFNAARADTIAYNIFDGSWGTYAASWSNVKLDFGSALVLPTSVSLIHALVTVFPLATSNVDASGTLSLRIIAPTGYEWLTNASDGFRGSVPNLTCGNLTCLIYSKPEVPVLHFRNELVLPRIVLRYGAVYGFQVRMLIPDRPPTRSMNVFFFELGYDSSSVDRRYEAGLVHPPPLRIIYAASIFSLCNRVAHEANVLEFHLRTVTELHQNDGFVFRGDKATYLTVVPCFPQTVPGMLPLPLDAQCFSFDDAVTSLPVIILAATQQRLPAGLYGFLFKNVRNSREALQPAGQWVMGTYGDVHRYPALRVIDRSLKVPAPQILKWTKAAGILNMPEWRASARGRDDRPAAVNTLIFYFQSYEPQSFPPSTPLITIRAPHGFVFEENCTSSVQTVTSIGAKRTNTSNSSNTSMWSAVKEWPCTSSDIDLEPWCPGVFETWPASLQPEACLGLGRSARLGLPTGSLDPNKFYAIEIAVTNPIVGDVTELWALDVGWHSSDSFSSFEIRTFDVVMTSLDAVSKVVRPLPPADPFTLVSIHFVPSANVPSSNIELGSGNTNPSPDEAQGSLVLTAPVGFVFGDDRNMKCPETLLEVAGRDPGDIASIFTAGGRAVGGDTDCRRLDERTLAFYFVGAKSLLRHHHYRLDVAVQNPETPQPAADWELSSFKRNFITHQVIPLDSIMLSGFPVSPRLAEWIVINDSLEFRGGFKVRTTTLAVRFALPFRNGDVVHITAPPGFELRSGSFSSDCADFRWPSAVLPLRDSPPPTCACVGEGIGLGCSLSLTARESVAVSANAVVMYPGDELRFNVSVLNADGPPADVENYWMVEHRTADNTLVGAAGHRGWEIFGQIMNISFVSVGPEQRAGAVADLRLELVPRVWAFVLELIVAEPPGFDFIHCRLDPPFMTDGRTFGGRLVVFGGQFPADQLTSLSITKVLSGFPGGNTRISLRLFNDGGLSRETGQRLNFISGFRLSGSVRVIDHRLWSSSVVEHFEQGMHDVVVPLLPPLANEPRGQVLLARAEIHFSVSVNVPMNKTLSVQSFAGRGETPFRPFLERGYQPELALCGEQNSQSVDETFPDGTFQAAPLACNVTENITFLNVVPLTFEGLPFGLNMHVNMSIASNGWALMATQRYRLRFWVKPSVDVTYLRVETLDGHVSPLNTNDGLTKMLRAVARMIARLEVAASRIPPRSVVDVDLFVQTGPDQADFTVLEVILPPGIAPYGSSMSSNPQGTRRLVARLDVDIVAMKEIRTTGKVFRLQIVTPEVSSIDIRWFVVAQAVFENAVGSLQQTSSRMTGWGYVDGFSIAPMFLHITYAPIVNFQGWIAISFTVPTAINGVFLIGRAPDGYLLQCPDKLDLLARPCETEKGSGPGSVGQTANVTVFGAGVREGTNVVHSFILGIITPESDEQAGDPHWDFLVHNEFQITVDAAVRVLGPNLVKGLFVQKPSLSWVTPPQHGATSVVTVELTLDRRVEKIKAILITLPARYMHDITHRNQLKNLNRFFPVAIDIEWRIFSNKDWVKILANDGVTEERDFLPAGVLQWQFPVRVPRQLPPNMEWYLSLCTDFECETPQDDSVLAAFPIPNTKPIKDARNWPTGATTAVATRFVSRNLLGFRYLLALFVASLTQKKL
eukprot:TRINITY_DN33933_c0_g1_i1.p1 TRINITY_DN33933_c0_g1~~TRINITY_DN33933_c0_g1_i1.p1  ORF type:complete len:3270 (+),score=363.14 TRINITY_DN33933_c0_g1_i1:1418-9811(+)